MTRHRWWWAAAGVVALCASAIAQQTSEHFMEPTAPCITAGRCSAAAADAWNRASWAMLAVALVLMLTGSALQIRGKGPVVEPRPLPWTGYAALLLAGAAWAALLVGGVLLLMMATTAQACVAWLVLQVELMALLLGQLLDASARRRWAAIGSQLGMALALPLAWWALVALASGRLTTAGIAIALVVWPALVALVVDRCCRRRVLSGAL